MDDRRRLELRRRLRNVGRRRLSTRNPAVSTSVSPSTGQNPLAEGMTIHTPLGSTFVREVRYPLDHRHGRYPLHYLATAPAEPLAALLAPSPSHPPRPERLRFLDTETTGLSGGTGTIVFLVGVAGFTDTHVWVRQYFLRDLHEEPALLTALAQDLAAADGVVTYNGQAFDLPLLDTRYVLNALSSPIPALPHLDLLPHARRIWRSRLGRVPLGHVEQHVLCHERTGPDVPGWMIPALYREYLTTQREELLTSVFYHNVHDVLSLIVLAGIILRCWHTPWTEPTLTEEDLLAQAKVLFRSGRLTEATVSLEHVLAHTHDPHLRHQAYMWLSRVLKRAGQWHTAVALWERWAEDLPLPDITPFEELAKYYEWHVRDWHTALHWVTRGEAQLSRLFPTTRARWQQALRRRRERLTRRLHREGRQP